MKAFEEPTLEQVQKLLRRMVGRRVAVIGDGMLDVYLMGRSSRVSPEAPVPVVEVEREERWLGGAANVAKGLVTLGARVRLCCLLGEDPDGQVFLDEARGLGIDVSAVLPDSLRRTTVKSRVIARQQQMLRFDRETRVPLSASLETRLVARARRCAQWAEAIILSDYGKGVLSPAVCRAALGAAGGKPVVVDPKELPWDRYRGAFLIKPNRHEAAAFGGEPLKDAGAAARVARRLRKALKVGHVLITRGGQGMTLLSGAAPGAAVRGERLLQLPSMERDVFDPTGAGDTVSAVLALALAAGADMAQSVWLANLAAGVEVGKFGAAAVSDQELLEALGSGAADCERKVLTREQAGELAAALRRRGKRVVFTNGCFDILHYGHVAYLERSRRLGDSLIVGVNSDASIRRLKGPGRPIQAEQDRVRIVAAQACVDAVVAFDEPHHQDKPLDLIRAIRPAVLTKGADYRNKREVVGWDLVEGWGGRVVLVEKEEGRSTSRLVSKAQG